MASEWLKQELKYLSFYFVISIVASAVAVVTTWVQQSEPGFDYNLVSLVCAMWPGCLFPWFCSFLLLSGARILFIFLLKSRARSE